MRVSLTEVLAEALADEYKARATYAAVLQRFGPVRPFVNIVESESRHIEALLGQYRRLGLRPPPDAWAGRVAAPPSLEDACRAAVAAERENAEMYDRLLAATDDADVREVLANLRRASQENHLPAFERCARRVARAARSADDAAPRRRRRRRRGSEA